LSIKNKNKIKKENIVIIKLGSVGRHHGTSSPRHQARRSSSLWCLNSCHCIAETSLPMLALFWPWSREEFLNMVGIRIVCNAGDEYLWTYLFMAFLQTLCHNSFQCKGFNIVFKFSSFVLIRFLSTLLW